MEDASTTGEVRYAPLTAAPRTAPRWARIVCLLVMLVAFVGLAQVGFKHIRKSAPDFEYFYKAGAWLRTHGALDQGYDVVDGRVIARGTLDWYWPFVSRLMAVFALLPPKPAGYVWLGLNLAALLATLRLVGRHVSGLPPRDWTVTQVAPLLLLAGYWYWEFRLNQIDNFTLLLLVASYVAWEHGRRTTAGLWLGVAVLLKLTPGLLVLWFVLKRQWRTVAAAVVTIALAGPVSDVLVLGPGETRSAYERWLHKAVTTGSQAGLVRTQREMDWRNQGLGAVLSRWLHPTDYSTRFENDPRIAARYAEDAPATLNVITLPTELVARIVTAISLAALGLLVWAARRPAKRLTAWQLRFEWALFVLAMLWFMPVMRYYHMIWAYPAVALLAAAVHYAGLHRGWSRLALVCLGLVVAGQFALLHRPLAAGGAALFSVLALAIPLLVLLARLARNPTALAPPSFEPTCIAAFPGVHAPHA